MRDKKILKIVWRKSIASLHRLTQAVQRANLRRTAGDPTWVVISENLHIINNPSTSYLPCVVNIVRERPLFAVDLCIAIVVSRGYYQMVGAI